MRQEIPSIARRTYGYYKANGARKLLKQIPRRLLLGSSGAPAPIHGSFPPDALGIPFRRVENPGHPPRLTLVIPSVKRKHLYAGSWTALKIFWEAHKAHGYRVRILSTSMPFDAGALASLDFFSPEEVATIESWDRERNQYCEVEDDEIFIATSWWTAYAIKRLELTHNVFYLVQDFEPSFYPWSQEYLLAMETYRFHYGKIINTSILYEFFRQQELLGDAGAMYFEPGINRELYHPGPERNYARTGKAVILVYGRPSVVRNLFDLACLSLEHFLRSYPTYRDKVESIISVGEEHATVAIDGFQMEARGKMPLEEWAGLARTSDVGVSLMCSPHPSYPPLEMAASGMVVVTNNMFNKDLSSLNDNFITDEPYVEQIAGCIKQAIDRLEDQREIDRNTALLHETLPVWEENLQKIVAFIGGGEGVPDGQDLILEPQ